MNQRMRFFRPGTQAIVYGLIVFGVLIITDQLAMPTRLQELQLIIGDGIGAAIVGVLVYWYERNRSKYLSEKLTTIELMNHHVRNALQLIADSVYVHGHAQQISEIQDAIKRIDWALRDILSGRAVDAYQAPNAATNNRPGGGSAPVKP